MADDPEDPTANPRSLPDCPRCGQSVLTVTILGPSTATAAPCGCRAPPEVLLVDPSANPDDDTETGDTAADDG